jgi:predicted ArsR family transcriptional regulator
MTKTEPVSLSDADVRERLIAHLRTHGPTRSKSLTNRSGMPYERSMRILEALRTEGIVEQVPGGSHRGLPTKAWSLVGAGTAARGTTLFAASATLAAMQAAARAALMQRAA